MPSGLAKELREVEPAVALPERDVRAGRPLLLNSILRFETLRRLARVVALVAFDVAAVFMAIWTALEIKAVIRRQPEAWRCRSSQAQDVAPLACLVTLLLFARSGLYGDRAARPGFARSSPRCSRSPSWC